MAEGQTHPEPGTKRLLTLRRAGCLLGLGVFALAVLAVFYDPAPDLPPLVLPPVPVPNALDTFSAAANEIKAKDRLPATSSDYHKWTAAERWKNVREGLGENQKALALIEAGLRQPFGYSLNDLDLERGLRKVSRIKDSAKLLIAVAEFERLRGEPDASLQTSVKILQIGLRAKNDGSNITRMIAAAIEAMGRHSAWQVADSAGKEAALDAARKLDQEFASVESFARHLERSRELEVREIVRETSKPNWRLEFVRQVVQADGLLAAPSALFDNRRRAIRQYRANVDSWVRKAKAPFKHRNPPPTTPSSPLARSWASHVEAMWFADVRAEAQVKLLMLALALRAYRLEHGRFPNRLTVLTPEYLSRIPADPFNDGPDFHYLNKGSSYLLYSIGPDGKDDGGTPIVDRSPAKPLYIVRFDSRGDIVAGVNK